MPRTRIKICGLTRADDVREAVKAGADAVGFVFYPPSPRALSPEDAGALARMLPAFVTPVALFVDPSPELVGAVLTYIPNALLQFHGKESEAFCASFGRPYLKALRMQDGMDVAAAIAGFPGASGILLDTYQPGVPGGTGMAFDWTRVPTGITTPLILAGGLTPANIAEAVRLVRPYAVDVSGGVEHAPGLKDRDKMRAFASAVQTFDAEAMA